MSNLRKNFGQITGSERTFFIRNGTIDGSQLGDPNANVNGSVTPVEFWIQPDPNDNFRISQISLEVSDGGTPNLEDYGNIPGPLLNGVQFFTEINGSRFELPRTINSNRELINLGLVVDRFSFSGNTTVANFVFNLGTFTKEGILLRGDTNDKFGIIVRDDLSTLIAHTLSVKGAIITRDIG